MSFAQARAIADAVLYEGYVLYPYRASAAKNQLRWQFGVVVPRGYSELGGEPWLTQTECLIEPVRKAALAVRLRFLQLQSRIIEQLVDRSNELFTPVEHLELNGQSLVTWDEGLERELDLPVLDLAEIIAAERVVPFEIDIGRAVEVYSRCCRRDSRTNHPRALAHCRSRSCCRRGDGKRGQGQDHCREP